MNEQDKTERRHVFYDGNEMRMKVILMQCIILVFATRMVKELHKIITKQLNSINVLLIEVMLKQCIILVFVTRMDEELHKIIQKHLNFIDVLLIKVTLEQ